MFGLCSEVRQIAPYRMKILSALAPSNFVIDMPWKIAARNRCYLRARLLDSTRVPKHDPSTGNPLSNPLLQVLP